MDPKFLFAQVKAVGDDGTFRAVASTPTLDRDGEIIEISAWEGSLARFRTNPVLIACHQHRLPSGSSPVIGSVPQIAVVGETLEFTGRFAGTVLGQEYRQLYAEGHMRAFSVGFIPMKGEWRDLKARKTFVHTEVELLEISAVPVPANPEALARMRAAAAAGLDGEALATLADLVLERLKAAVDSKVFVRDVAAAIGLSDALKPVAAKIEELQMKIGEVSDLLAHLAPDTLGLDGPAGAAPPAAAAAGAGGKKENGADEGRRLAEEARALEKACGD